MIWQLLQVRHIKNAPLILVGEMWTDLVDWAQKHMIEGTTQLANPEDISIPVCLNNADEAISLLREHHDNWEAAT